MCWVDALESGLKVIWVTVKNISRLGVVVCITISPHYNTAERSLGKGSKVPVILQDKSELLKIYQTHLWLNWASHRHRDFSLKKGTESTKKDEESLRGMRMRPEKGIFPGIFCCLLFLLVAAADWGDLPLSGRNQLIKREIAKNTQQVGLGRLILVTQVTFIDLTLLNESFLLLKI